MADSMDMPGGAVAYGFSLNVLALLRTLDPGRT